jgi:hypothetical protein
MADQPNTPHEPDAAASARTPATPPSAHGASAELIEDRLETVTVRRAPKYAVFVVLGAALGLLVAMILTFSFNDPDATSPNTGLVYSTGQVFGFVALVCITVGVALGGIVALLFDRALSRRTRRLTVDRESVTSVD